MLESRHSLDDGFSEKDFPRRWSSKGGALDGGVSNDADDSRISMSEE